MIFKKKNAKEDGGDSVGEKKRGKTEIKWNKGRETNKISDFQHYFYTFAVKWKWKRKNV